MDSQITVSGGMITITKCYELRTKISKDEYGVKTEVVNIGELSKTLGRPPIVVGRYMGCELGVLSLYRLATGVFELPGIHSIETLRDCVTDFSKKYVECYNCTCPETRLVVTKSKKVHLKCPHCRFVSKVNMSEGTACFIVWYHFYRKKKSESQKLAASQPQVIFADPQMEEGMPLPSQSQAEADEGAEIPRI